MFGVEASTWSPDRRLSVSGVKTFSAVLAPPKVSQSNKAGGCVGHDAERLRSELGRRSLKLGGCARRSQPSRGTSPTPGQMAVLKPMEAGQIAFCENGPAVGAASTATKSRNGSIAMQKCGDEAYMQYIRQGCCKKGGMIFLRPWWVRALAIGLLQEERQCEHYTTLAHNPHFRTREFFSHGSRLEPSNQQWMFVVSTKQPSSHLARHVSRAVVVVPLRDFFCTLSTRTPIQTSSLFTSHEDDHWDDNMYILTKWLDDISRWYSISGMLQFHLPFFVLHFCPLWTFTEISLWNVVLSLQILSWPIITS